MTKTRWDQASRYTAKIDPIGFLCYMLRETPEELRFRIWLDTRTLPWPGDPERTCDTVAWLGDADPAREWAVPAEFCTVPDETLFGRLLVYLGQLWLEIRPTDAGGERFDVAALVVNLTGHGRTSRDMRLRETGMRTTLQVFERNLADEDAAVVLAGMAAGLIRRCLLPWVPLMQKGGEPAIIALWLELARQELNSRRRADYGGLALVFAELTGHHALWKQALEGWNMTESKQVLEWMAEGKAQGRIEGAAEILLGFLEDRFPPTLPPELIAAIRASTNLTELQGWAKLVSKSDSLDAFRRSARL